MKKQKISIVLAAFPFLAVLLSLMAARPAASLQEMPTVPVYLAVIVKQSTPTPTLTPTSEPTPEPTLPPVYEDGDIVIQSIYYNGAGSTEPDEYVQIRNNDIHNVQLSDWTLVDNQSHVFTFPSYSIQPGQICRIYTNQVQPAWCGFSYGSSSAIWNNSGDCAYLRNSQGVLKSQQCY